MLTTPFVLMNDFKGICSRELTGN